MVRLGTMRNGVIVPDDPGAIPEGSRVALDVAGDDEDGSWPADCPPPPTTETREEFLQNLRDDIAAVQAGARGKPLGVFAAELKREFGVRQNGQ